MKRIALDVAHCRTVDELYDVLLPALGAPDWHGRNLDALWDSITSDLNEVMPPCSIEVSGKDSVPAEVASKLTQVQKLFAEARRTEAIQAHFKLI